jgi:predicted Ser/Thr protein kinase
VIGREIRHYQVETLLGRGGMGVVYRARDGRLGRAVALKFLASEVTADPDRRSRFLREARAACAVNHPAIAQVYDVDETDEGIFIAMELVEGRTVRDLVQQRELDVLGSLEIAGQVAAGLAKAHEAGIVHRDIKPENIMVTPDGHAKILDFGLAKLRDTEPSSGDQLSNMETLARTQAGMVVGTLRYMSPEQARGQAVDHRSDIFSLGILLYEMVTGALPFSGNTPLDTLHAIAFEETKPVTQLRPHVPPGVQRVITRCLRKRPQDRYPEARELLNDLKAVQRDVESGVSAKVPLLERLRQQIGGFGDVSPRDWLVPGVLAAVFVAAAVLLIVQQGFVGAVLLVGVGLWIWRRVRNRAHSLTRRFVAKVQRMPEVSLIAVDGSRILVLADRAAAKTYVRVNALLDDVNARLFFGDPFTVAVRDDLPPGELRAVLQRPGVLYVRDDLLVPALEPTSPSGPPPVPPPAPPRTSA